MAESASPLAGNSPASSEAAAVGSDVPISLGLARAGTLRVGDPLASKEPEVAQSTSTD